MRTPDRLDCPAQLTGFQHTYIFKTQPLVERSVKLALAFASIAAARFLWSGSQAPRFSSSDNPAAESDSTATRTLTFLYLPLANLALLLWPQTLSYDWSMEAVPLVTSALDWRVPLTAAFYGALGASVWRLFRGADTPTIAHAAKPTPSVHRNGHHHHHSTTKNGHHHRNGHVSNGAAPKNGMAKNGFLSNGVHHNTTTNGHHHRIKNGSTEANGHVSANESTERQLEGQKCFMPRRLRCLFALALLLITFLPASNLAFYVGFVLAERVLYAPSLAFCWLLAEALDALAVRVAGRRRRALVVALALSAPLHAYYAQRTWRRNADWHDEEALYLSGVDVNPAKSWSNLGNVWMQRKEPRRAEDAYRRALEHRPNMADAYYNL